MPGATGFILRLTDTRLSVLNEQLRLFGRFAEPVPEFAHSRQAALVCFVLDTKGVVHYVAPAARGMSAGTGLSRLNLSSIVELAERVSLDPYAAITPPRIRRALLTRITRGGLLTQKQFEALVDAASGVNEELGSLLGRYTSTRRERLGSLHLVVREQLAFQKEAVGTALSLAGLERDPLRSWEPPATGSPLSFLQGIPQARLREDPMVLNDARTVPGFEEVRNFITGGATFENEGGVRLTVLVANRQPLEELTGADLIYYNETFQSFIMVQYKAMEHSDGNEAIYRLPNSQLDEEISRMKKIQESLASLGAPEDVRGYRLAWNPFFLKLCPRIVFDPDASGLMPGMYLPLEKWYLLEKSPTSIGKHGGRGITYANVERYFDNTSFIMLVRDAWVGTTPAQSSILQDAIRATLESGRAVVIAVRSAATEAVA